MLLIAFFSLDYMGQTYTRMLTQDSFMLKTHPASSNRSHIALLLLLLAGEAVLAVFSFVYFLRARAPNPIFDGLVFDENGRNKNLHVTSSYTFLPSVFLSTTEKKKKKLNINKAVSYSCQKRRKRRASISLRLFLGWNGIKEQKSEETGARKKPVDM